MRPLQISLETAQKLSKALGVPIEQIMHMPQHILVQKLLELEKQNKAQDETKGNLNE
jgi:tRNA A37 threonylcarbamoyltransferase TsaD